MVTQAMFVSRSPDPAAPLDEGSPRYRGWRVVVACFTIAMFAWCFGFYGHGVWRSFAPRMAGRPR